MTRNLLILLLVPVALFISQGCESEYSPTGQETTVIYDSTFIYDTTVIYDSTCVPCDTCTTDSMIYDDCLVLEKCSRVGTLGRPGYLVTFAREKTNGHPIEFCLYVEKHDDKYVGIISATHLKSDWPVVRVEVIVNDSRRFFWDIGEKHQTYSLTF